MTEKKKRILKGRIIVALHEELGRKPTPAEIERYFRAAKVLYSTIVPAFFERQKQKRDIRQLRIA